MAESPTQIPKIPGIMNERDRHWRVSKDDFEGWLTDYNWEITGASENVAAIDPDIRYSHSAWYWTAELRQRGYSVEAVHVR
jgi:hypothetical protein